MIENNVAEDARKLGQNTLMAEVNERVLSYLKDHRPEADDEGALQMESLALEQNGDVLVARGRFVDAKQSYQDSLDISDRLLALTKRNDAEWQGIESGIVKSIDDLVRFLPPRVFPRARRYRETRDIRENLVRSNPEISAPANFQLQVDLASSLEHLGDLFMQKEDYNKAEESFGAAANIRKTLDSSRKGNERQQQAVKLALSSSLDKLGNVCNAHRKYSDALAFYLESFSLRRSLVTREPQNLEFQEMLAYSFFHIGDVSREQQHVVEALQTLSIMRKFFNFWQTETLVIRSANTI
jgi:tetratricopeptide (TPR) repeat protein